jgi:hypothetical protein
VFYELVREWEDSHSAAGWNMEEHMGDRIRYNHVCRLNAVVITPLVWLFILVFIKGGMSQQYHDCNIHN